MPSAISTSAGPRTNLSRPCSAYGITLCSDFPLYLPDAPQGRAIDMTISQADDPYDANWVPDPDQLLTSWRCKDGCHWNLTARTASGFRIRFHPSCEFDLSPDLSLAGYRVSPEGDPAIVPVLTAGTVLALRMMLADEFVLHSSVVEIDGRGLAFVGASGQGKSTMATLMCAAGATLVTDDVGRVRFDAGRAYVATGAPESRLRPSASALAERMTATGTSARATGDARCALALRGVDISEVALDAVVVPVPRRDGGELELTAVRGLQAIALLAAYPRVLGVVDRTLLDRSFHGVADLADRVPVYVAQVPWGEPPDPHTAAGLIKGLGWC